MWIVEIFRMSVDTSCDVLVYMTILQIEEMSDKLIPEENIMAIQEQLSGFIVEQVIDPKGEFYYDGLSNIDNRRKYDNIRIYM